MSKFPQQDPVRHRNMTIIKRMDPDRLNHI